MSADIKKAAELLRNGDVVGIPTETVYGLAGSIASKAGIQKIFEIKERPFFDPLIVHVANIEQAKAYTTNWNTICDVLAENFWPGPLTMVLKKSYEVDDLITAGLDSVGVRMPNHAMTLELIEELGNPVAAPSANKFKKTSPTSFEHVKESFPDTMVLDGGACEVGIESTVIGVFDDKVSIYRPGMISKGQIEKTLEKNNIVANVEVVESPVAPGQLKHHYMPKVPVILVKDQAADLSQIDSKIIENSATLYLGFNSAMAARKLYQDLRELDKDHSCIIIKLNEEQLASDEWQGIINRIEKAASFFI